MKKLVYKIIIRTLWKEKDSWFFECKMLISKIKENERQLFLKKFFIFLLIGCQSKNDE